MMPTNSAPQASSSRLSAAPETEFWSQFEEQLLDGRFPLRKFVSGFQTGATFLSQLDGPEQQRVAVKVVSAAARDAQWLSLSWGLAQRLQHPNVVRVYATAQASLGGLRVVYAVTDYADESLECILEERSLTESEGRELLLTCSHALHFLHRKGLIHGSLEPSAIVAVGEAIKLLSDHLTPISEGRAVRRELGQYDPPEVATAGRSPASDVWALGAIVYQALTRQLPATASHSAMLALPQPFATILPNCLTRDPGQRWMPSAIEGALPGAASDSAPVTSKVTPAKIATLSPMASGVAWWKIAGPALGVLLLLVVWFAKASRPVQPAPAATPPSASRAKPAQPIPAPPRPAPITVKVSPFTPPAAKTRLAEESPVHAQQRSIWRVVVYTYSTAAEAERKAAAINRRWPELHASVFSP